MKPIINPWIFYFASVSDMAKTIVLVVMIIAIFIYVATWLSDIDEEVDADYKTIKKVRKSSLIILILLSLFEIFMPDSKTIYQMTVASCITEDNIKVRTETIKETVDYIIDKINESQDS